MACPVTCVTRSGQNYKSKFEYFWHVE